MNQYHSELLQKIVDVIIASVHPSTIVLFGSAAREEMNQNSDFDLLVIVPNHYHRRQTVKTIYKAIFQIGFATDIVVATEQDIETHRLNKSLVYYHALHEGKQLYAA